MTAKIVIFVGKNKEIISDMKRLTLIAIVLSAIFSFSSCSSCSGDREMTDQQQDSLKRAKEMERLRMEEPEFIIETTHGTMKVKLYSKTPKHRDNFRKLVKEKYYDGIRFHRVIEGFMIQAGDPYSRDTSLINQWGTGGPAYTVPAEFVAEYTHKKGALAAARKGDMANPRKASSGSQFYIVHDPYACSPLDGQYTVFGEVTEGLEVIDRIASVATDRYDRPYEDVIINSIRQAGLPVEETPESEQSDTTAAE